MALYLTTYTVDASQVTLDAGAPDRTAYARVMEYTFQPTARRLAVLVYIYASEAAYRAGAKPVDKLELAITGNQFDTVDTALRTRLYTWLTNTRFSGATTAPE